MFKKVKVFTFNNALPLILYVIAFNIMDMEVWKEVLVALMFLFGAFIAFRVGEHVKK